VVGKLDRLPIFVVGGPLHGQEGLALGGMEQLGLGGGGPSGPDGLRGQVEGDPGGPHQLVEAGPLQALGVQLDHPEREPVAHDGQRLPVGGA
jgi:hypothetical protein